MKLNKCYKEIYEFKRNFQFELYFSFVKIFLNFLIKYEVFEFFELIIKNRIFKF